MRRIAKITMTGEDAFQLANQLARMSDMGPNIILELIEDGDDKLLTLDFEEEVDLELN